MSGNKLDDCFANSFEDFYHVGEQPKVPLEEIWETYRPKDFKNIKKVSGWPLLFAIIAHSKWVYFKIFLVSMLKQVFNFSKLYIMGKSIRDFSTLDPNEIFSFSGKVYLTLNLIAGFGLIEWVE